MMSSICVLACPLLSWLQVETWIHDHPKIPLTCHNPFPARIAFRALYAVVGATGCAWHAAHAVLGSSGIQVACAHAAATWGYAAAPCRIWSPDPPCLRPSRPCPSWRLALLQPASSVSAAGGCAGLFTLLLSACTVMAAAAGMTQQRRAAAVATRRVPAPHHPTYC